MKTTLPRVTLSSAVPLVDASKLYLDKRELGQI